MDPLLLSSILYFFILLKDLSLKFNSFVLSLEEIRSYPYLPRGMFVRLICMTFSWSQTGPGFSANSISKHMTQVFQYFLVFKYGNQLFRICLLQRDNLIMVEVEGENSFPV